MSKSEQSKDDIIAQLREENALLKASIVTLEKKVDMLIRLHFGSKSEKIDPAQLELLLNGVEAKKPDAATSDEAATELEKELQKELKVVKERKPRQPRLPENLPTTEETIIPAEVLIAPDDYRRIGERISEKLDVEPALYTRRIIIRPTYVKKNEPIPSLHTAPLPPSVLEGSILTPSLLANICTAKYCDHIPLYRQEQIMARRHDINIPRNTLCHWMEVAAETLEPLWKHIGSQLRGANFIKIDETPIDYLKPGHGSTKKGKLWIYHNPHLKLVLYDWQTSGSAECLDTILTDNQGNTFRGIIQSDGASAYNKWAAQHEDVWQAGCWAHVRRKFYEALIEDPMLTAAILRMIQKLYRIEKKYNDSPHQVRRHQRSMKSKPILKKLYRVISKVKRKHLPKSNLGKAAYYALAQWEKLIIYQYHGEIDIDNNSVERAVRPTKLGAKNWLFVGGEDTGWRSAVIYTLIENCRTLGHDPYAYLKWVFNKLPSATNQDDLAQFLSQAWSAQMSKGAPQSVVAAA